MAADIKSLINRNRTIARQYADKASATTLKDSLVKAQKELVDRIDASVRLGREESFTAVQAQTALKQMQDVLKGVTAALKTSVVDTGKIVSAAGVTSTVAYVRASEKKYHGVAAASALRLDEAMMLDKVVSGTSSSQLSRLMSSGEEDAEVGVLHPGKAGILERYHHNVVGKFEDQLRGHYLARRPWEETREALIKESPLLTGKEPGVATTWAERILRTETSFAQNKSNVAAMQVANESLGDGCKILVATFDDRTAADSYAVHGQIRRLTEPFDTWSGSFMHPPARPNDREVVVPHRISWPIPAELTPKSDGEVSARWTYEGRKGSPPGRPKMTTIELSEFGKESTKREQLGIESEKQPEFKYPTVE